MGAGHFLHGSHFPNNELSAYIKIIDTLNSQLINSSL